MKAVIPLMLTFVAALFLSAIEPAQAQRAPAQKQPQRWCLKGDEGTNCSFDTLKQCQATRVGGHGTCFRARRATGGGSQK